MVFDRPAGSNFSGKYPNGHSPGIFSDDRTTVAMAAPPAAAGAYPMGVLVHSRKSGLDEARDFQ